MWRSLCLLLSLLAFAAAPASEAATCPLDLTYVSTYPWDDTSCAVAANNMSDCCQALLSVYGIGAAQRLHDTGQFRLPDVATSAACLADLQANLSAAPLSLPSSIVSACFPSPDRFVTTCAGVYTRADWTARLGNATALDSACDGDLTDLSRCSNCLDAGMVVSSQLSAVNSNTSDITTCFIVTILYASAFVNRYGPKDPRAACIFGITPTSPSSSDHDSSSSHSVAVYASVFAAIALVLASSSIGLFLWLARRRRKTMSDSATWERSSRLYFRPNTGSICFDIKELDKATASFSQRNLIGRGGFGVVYKGTLSDGSLVAVKKAGRAGEVLEAALTRDDGDGDGGGNSNPKGIMERFVLVGVLCAHVMVALRPTIMEALKMLEGDIELPAIPDRPLPLSLAHGSVFAEGNTFSASPTLHGPRLDTGDMLR
ncbi:hypothetical protein OPV22_004952 [Ensete ventricosum]|uniref:SPARK domain-containing protein n=1 Tax=Ensete ventricosum TaxID=4639 RepID=A0AAV8RHD4_ENSVE|nr:hypothetical protein OPV22_004952 [Ensete ventricosum]